MFSGGTEASAFNIRAVSALIRAGFVIENLDHSSSPNPHYLIKFDDDRMNLSAFSKLFNHHLNPKKEFAAAMVCSRADKDCPLIPGADARISIPYDDPGEFDGSPSESDKYDETCLKAATEMLFVFSGLKNLNN